MVLQALPGVSGQAGGGCDAAGGKVGKGGIIRLAVVLDDLFLAGHTQVLAAQASIGHDDEGDMVVAEWCGVLTIGHCQIVLYSTTKHTAPTAMS